MTDQRRLHVRRRRFMRADVKVKRHCLTLSSGRGLQQTKAAISPADGNVIHRALSSELIVPISMSRHEQR